MRYDFRDAGSFVFMLLVVPVFGVVFALSILLTFPIWLPYLVWRRFHGH